MSIPAPLVGKSTILPVASLVFRAFVRFVRADERMPRMSGVVKNEGEYEFQMGCGGQLATATLRPLPATARLGAVPSERRALAA